MRSNRSTSIADQIVAASAAVNPNVEVAGDAEAAGDVAKPNNATVLGLLALTSLTFSYLGAYAVSGALVQAEVLHRWRPDADPRPKWLVEGFCVLLLVFMCIGALARHLSRRELRQIDEMSDEAAELEGA
jgi:hypothetical protein